jgi:transcriptional regulator with XRE-family HTH domain
MARADAGLTISELAERAGVSRDTISHAEKGRHGLQATTLHKIARALGKTPSELLAEEERLAPKVENRSLLEQSFEDALAEERLASWEAAVDNARRLREGGRAQLAELLAAWQDSRDHGELRSARRGCLGEIEELFNKAYSARNALTDILFPGSFPPEEDWEEVRAADRFYQSLIEMMRDAGFRIQERKSEPPEVEEPDAA